MKNIKDGNSKEIKIEKLKLHFNTNKVVGGRNSKQSDYIGITSR